MYFSLLTALKTQSKILFSWSTQGIFKAVLMLLSGEVYVRIWRAISYLNFLNLALKNPLIIWFCLFKCTVMIYSLCIFFIYLWSIVSLMQRQILLPLACTVKSVVYISGGEGGYRVEEKWGWLKNLKMENPNLLIYCF